MAPILVTGATGTVGRHVVQGLVQREVDVLAATRHPEAAADDLGVPTARFDFQDASTYAVFA